MHLLIVVYLCLLISVNGLNPLVIKGYKIFDAVTGSPVFVKGVDYYPRPNHGTLNVNNYDFYTKAFQHVWENDIKHFKRMGITAVRLYAVDPSKTHDQFMAALSNSGIYAVIGLAASCENCAITKDKAPGCYPADLKIRGQQIIKQFAKYDNVLGFSAGNEVNHYAPIGQPDWNAPCQKKFLRDMRQYINSCSESMRRIPVGLVVADTDREANAKYYNCRTNPSDGLETAEWYGVNAYLHCDGKVTDVSKAAGFDKLLESFRDIKYSIPVLLTEFGCLNPSFPTIDGFEAQRTFHQVQWLSTAKFRDYIAGGFVFEFSTELVNSQSTSPYPFTKFGPQNYGLGYYSPKSCDHMKVECTYRPFPNSKFLSKAYHEIDVSNEETMEDFDPKMDRGEDSECPSTFPKLAQFSWKADNEESLSCPNGHAPDPSSDSINPGKGKGDHGLDIDTDSSSGCKYSTLHSLLLAIVAICMALP